MVHLLINDDIIKVLYSLSFMFDSHPARVMTHQSYTGHVITHTSPLVLRSQLRKFSSSIEFTVVLFIKRGHACLCVIEIGKPMDGVYYINTYSFPNKTKNLKYIQPSIDSDGRKNEE